MPNCSHLAGLCKRRSLQELIKGQTEKSGETSCSIAPVWAQGAGSQRAGSFVPFGPMGPGICSFPLWEGLMGRNPSRGPCGCPVLSSDIPWPGLAAQASLPHRQPLIARPAWSSPFTLHLAQPREERLLGAPSHAHR